jgi:hypothetical protein
VFGAVANSQKNGPAGQNQLSNASDNNATTANVCLGVAGAAAIASAVTWFVLPPPHGT